MTPWESDASHDPDRYLASLARLPLPTGAQIEATILDVVRADQPMAATSSASGPPSASGSNWVTSWRRSFSITHSTG